jgi:hypothetical protein
VGNVTVSYNTTGCVTVTYNLYSGYQLTTANLYVGKEIVPKINGQYTIVPEQFPYNKNSSEYKGSGMFSTCITPAYPLPSIYVIAHATVTH